jgi:ribosomal-protein-alanine acetyltransferase
VADAEALAALEAVCFGEPWSPRALQQALEDEKYRVLLAQSAGQAVGYAFGWNLGEEAELARIGVLPEFRGEGQGERLMRALLLEFAGRGVRTVFLEVRSSNAGAHRLYARCGFEVVGRRREYYADGEDAVLMRTNLDL